MTNVSNENQKHTAGKMEPQKEYANRSKVVVGREGFEPQVIAYTVKEVGQHDTYANARRICATWNACDGLDTAILESGVVKELIEAVQHAMTMLPLWGAPQVTYEEEIPEEHRDEYGALFQMQHMFESAIAKATNTVEGEGHE